MGDDHPVLGWLLETLVAVALIGTFAVYGNAGNHLRPASEPGEMATLDIPR